MKKPRNLIKFLTILLTLVVGLFPYGTVLAAGETAVAVSAPADVDPGEQFTVNITVAPGTTPIAGVQFDLAFNPSLVTVNNVAEGNLLSQGGSSTYFVSGTIDNIAGTISGVAGAITTPGQSVAAPGTFAVITMTASAQGGTSSLTLSNVVVGDVNGQPVQITVTWTPRYNQAGAYAVRFEVSDGSLTDYEDVTVTAVKVGQDWDINVDTKANVLDMVLVGQRWSQNGLTAWVREDSNEDGTINVLDMIIIGQHWTG
jgi:hypothetical protein